MDPFPHRFVRLQSYTHMLKLFSKTVSNQPHVFYAGSIETFQSRTSSSLRLTSTMRTTFMFSADQKEK